MKQTRRQASIHALPECKLRTCGAEFKPKRKDQVFCSPEHKKAYHELIREEGRKVVEGKVGHIHYANLATSPRLQRVVDLLKDGREYTTIEIINKANVCNTSTCTSEINKQLQAVSDRIGKTVESIKCQYRNGLYYYRMIFKDSKAAYGGSGMKYCCDENPNCNCNRKELD